MINVLKLFGRRRFNELAPIERDAAPELSALRTELADLKQRLDMAEFFLRSMFGPEALELFPIKLGHRRRSLRRRDSCGTRQR